MSSQKKSLSDTFVESSGTSVPVLQNMKQLQLKDRRLPHQSRSPVTLSRAHAKFNVHAKLSENDWQLREAMTSIFFFFFLLFFLQAAGWCTQSQSSGQTSCQSHWRPLQVQRQSDQQLRPH